MPLASQSGIAIWTYAEKCCLVYLVSATAELIAALLIDLRLANNGCDKTLCMTAAKPAARAKRKRDEANDGGGQESEGCTTEPLWRVNFEEFNCRLRYTRQRLQTRPMPVAVPEQKEHMHPACCFARQMHVLRKRRSGLAWHGTIIREVFSLVWVE